MISGRWEEMTITGQAIISHLIDDLLNSGDRADVHPACRLIENDGFRPDGMHHSPAWEHVRVAPILIPPEERRFWLTF